MEHPIKMDDLGYHYFRKHPYDIVNHLSFILAQHLGRFSCSRGWRLAVNLPGEAPFWTTSGEDAGKGLANGKERCMDRMSSICFLVLFLQYMFLLVDT